MPFPLLGLIGLSVAAGLLVACEEKTKEPAPSLPPPEPKPKKDPPVCPGTSYSIFQEEDEILLCHEDKLKDGIHHPDSDKLKIRVEDQFLPLDSGAEASSYREKFGLPNFRGMNLDSWKDVRNSIFLPESNSWSQIQEKNFSEVTEYCRDKKLDLKDVYEIARNTRPHREKKSLSSEEKIFALYVSAILLAIQRNQNDSFYMGNKEFVDTVLENIKMGNFRVRGNILGSIKSVGGYKGLGKYDSLGDFLEFPKDWEKLNTPYGSAFTIHELWHLYQDIQKKRLNVVETELEAYLVEGEFFLYDNGMDPKKNDIQVVEELIKKSKLSQDSTVALGIFASFFRIRKDQSQWNAYRSKLLKKLEMEEILKTYQGFLQKVKSQLKEIPFLKHYGRLKSHHNQETFDSLTLVVNQQLNARKNQKGHALQERKKIKLGEAITDSQIIDYQFAKNYERIMEFQVWEDFYKKLKFEMEFYSRNSRYPNESESADINRRLESEMLAELIPLKLYEDSAVLFDGIGKSLPLGSEK